MPLSPDTIQALRASFAIVAKNRATAGKLFYARLFEVAPELRPMFKSDLTSQALKLVDTIGLCIGQLSYPETVTLTLTALGERHAAYGAKPEHYNVVGEVLIWTLAEMMGDGFTPEIRSAWIELYGTAAQVMRRALDEPGA